MADYLIDPKFTVSKLHDQVVAGYLLFRPGLRAHDTHLFYNNDGATLAIDVDEAGAPIGMEHVHLENPITSEMIRDAKKQLQSKTPIQVVFELFVFATKMIAVKESESNEAMMRLGDELIKDAVGHIKSIDAGAVRGDASACASA